LICTNPDYFDRNEKRWRCCLIPNGIDVERFCPGPGDRERFGLPANKTVVLMVSALIPSKRVLEGVRAVAEMDNAFLVVAGDGPLRDEIAGAAAKLLPDRYLRLEVSPTEIPMLYRSADVFLHMSLEESFGNVFLEAMACGVPIVAHESARARWIVGSDQHLTDTNIQSATASALRAALGAAGQRGRPNIDRFAWREVARQYDQFFREVL
jgi:glycosyltransferase involved in cell wall biosynthesis